MSAAAQHEPPLDLQDLRAQARSLGDSRREARRDFQRYSKDEADAERDYRQSFAVKFAEFKSKGEPNGAAEKLAAGLTSELRHRRDIAHAMAKSCLLRIDELERDASILRHISERSSRIEGPA